MRKRKRRSAQFKFKVALESEFGAQGSANSLFSILPEGSVVVFHDLELWWERSEDGHAVLEEIVRLIESHGSRCFFILGINGRHLLSIRIYDSHCGRGRRKRCGAGCRVL